MLLSTSLTMDNISGTPGVVASTIIPSACAAHWWLAQEDILYVREWLERLQKMYKYEHRHLAQMLF